MLNLTVNFNDPQRLEIYKLAKNLLIGAGRLLHKNGLCWAISTAADELYNYSTTAYANGMSTRYPEVWKRRPRSFYKKR